MDDAARLVEALRRLQRDDAAGALAIAADLTARNPGNARAHVATGMALRMMGRLAEARAAVEHALVLHPADYALHFELAVVLELAGDAPAALARYQRALALRPGFAGALFGATRLLAEEDRIAEALALVETADPRDPVARHEKGWILHRSGQAALAAPLLEAAAAADPANAQWQLDAAKALADAGRDDAARSAYERAARAQTANAAVRIAYGRFLVSRADYAGAADAFAAARALDPSDAALPIYLAQAELIQQHWEAGWAAYGERESRRAFAAARAAHGLEYRLPPLDSLAGKLVILVSEQGLGDALFYLRFAPQLAARGARLEFAGDARLAPLLQRTGLFEAIRDSNAAAEADAALPILLGDLPALPGIAQVPPTLRIAPLPERLNAWRAVLEAAGPRPWIGITWRAGTPADVLAHGLYKSVPTDALCRALRPLGGTVLALQRHPDTGEIEAASDALGRPVMDLTRANDDLEDALALVALLDRYVTVSNTNIHLAAAAGATADVLVPFPPEWRWTAEGESPWYPAFGVHRQARGGDWSAALATLA